MSMAAALPLGFSSRCEVLDMRLERDIPLEGLRDTLEATLPTGIRVLSVEQVDDRAPALQTQVESAEYEVTLTEPADGSELQRKVESVMDAESLPRTRRGREYDLRPLIFGLKVVALEGRDLAIQMRLSAKEGATGRPEEVLDVLGVAFEETRIERTRLNFRSRS
jgi:radical SAM-linked protein